MLIGNGRRRFTLSKPFFSSNSKHFKPQKRKATQTTNIKMQSQPFFFYHNKKTPRTNPQTSKSPGKIQTLHQPVLKNPKLQHLPKYSKNIEETNKKTIAHIPLSFKRLNVFWKNLISNFTPKRSQKETVIR